MKHSRVAITALAVSGLLAASACSGEPAASDAPPATVAWHKTEGGAWSPAAVTVKTSDLECGAKAPDPKRGVTPTSIKIAGLGTMSGPTVSIFSDAEAGARARFARANAEGGVHGRRIEFTGMQDDGLDPTRQVDVARRLIADGAFAAAPVMTQIPNFKQTFCDGVMPHFGWGFNSAWCGSGIAFPVTGCIVGPKSDYLSIGAGAVDDLVNGRPKTIALLGNEEEAAQLGNVVLKEGFQSSGYQVVYAENPLSGRSPIADASPLVNAIMTSADGGPPTFVYLVADFANTNTMVQALRAGGFEGTILSALGYDPRLASAQQFQGLYTTLQWAPFEAADNPFVAQMAKDFDRYEPATSKGLPAAGGYISADMLVAALDAAGPDLTVDSFISTLNHDWVYSTPGFRGEARFPANHVIAVPCGTIVVLHDQRFEQTSPLACTDPIRR